MRVASLQQQHHRHATRYQVHNESFIIADNRCTSAPRCSAVSSSSSSSFPSPPCKSRASLQSAIWLSFRRKGALKSTQSVLKSCLTRLLIRPFRLACFIARSFYNTNQLEQPGPRQKEDWENLYMVSVLVQHRLLLL